MFIGDLQASGPRAETAPPQWVFGLKERAKEEEVVGEGAAAYAGFRRPSGSWENDVEALTELIEVTRDVTATLLSRLDVTGCRLTRVNAELQPCLRRWRGGLIGAGGGGGVLA